MERRSIKIEIPLPNRPMLRKLTFSLKSLAVLVAMIAVGLAIFNYATESERSKHHGGYFSFVISGNSGGESGSVPQIRHPDIRSFINSKRNQIEKWPPTIWIKRADLCAPELKLLAGRAGGTLKTGRHIAYQKDKPVANLFWSSDALQWESTKLQTKPYAERLELLFVTGDRVCGIIKTDGVPPQSIISTDGKSWTPQKALLDDWKVMVRDAHLRRVAHGDDRIVFIGDYGARLSSDTIDDQFQAVPKASAKDTLIDIAFGNGVFVGGGLHGLRMRSKDGLEWTDRVVGEESEHINSLIFDGQQFVGIGQGATYTSSGGKTWQRIPNENSPTVAACGDGVYVGSFWPGKLMRSTDGIHWAPVLELPRHILGMGYGRLGIE